MRSINKKILTSNLNNLIQGKWYEVELISSGGRVFYMKYFKIEDECILFYDEAYSISTNTNNYTLHYRPYYHDDNGVNYGILCGLSRVLRIRMVGEFRVKRFLKNFNTSPNRQEQVTQV
jgi:hypothetical protein